jgi:large subunit ribosomal protein L20
MNRIKRGPNSKAKKILQGTKGQYGARSRSYQTAKQSLIKAYQYNYRDRKQRKRDFRSLWITRINGALKSYSISYSKFIYALKEMNINLNRKMLSELALFNQSEFQKIIEKVLQFNNLTIKDNQ